MNIIRNNLETFNYYFRLIEKNGQMIMRNISEIKAFEDEFELFELLVVRIIGKEVRSGGSLGNTAPALWGEVFSSGACNILFGLPHVVNGLYGWTCEYEAATDTFIYIVCAMTPAGTPVPDGFVYRDIPTTVVAKGLFGEDIQAQEQTFLYFKGIHQGNYIYPRNRILPLGNVLYLFSLPYIIIQIETKLSGHKNSSMLYIDFYLCLCDNVLIKKH